jgi:hypothetical protein
MVNRNFISEFPTIIRQTEDDAGNTDSNGPNVLAISAEVGKKSEIRSLKSENSNSN